MLSIWQEAESHYIIASSGRGDQKVRVRFRFRVTQRKQASKQEKKINYHLDDSSDIYQNKYTTLVRDISLGEPVSLAEALKCVL